MTKSILFAILILTLAGCSASPESAPTVNDQSGVIADGSCEVVGFDDTNKKRAWQFGDENAVNPDPDLCKADGRGAFTCADMACLKVAMAGTCPVCATAVTQ
jgi:hypothetical protein